MKRFVPLALVLALLPLAAACGGGSTTSDGGGGSGPPPFLWAADGKGGVPGNLYRIDPTTGAATTVGPIGFGVTGLALHPETSVLYATESVAGIPDAHLLTIDTTTGTGTIVGPLRQAMTGSPHNSIAGLTFVGTRLIGWSEDGSGSSGDDEPVEINLATGVVTPLGGGITSAGSGMATSPSGVVYVAPDGSTGILYTVDPMTGVVTPGPTLTGASIDGAVNALAFVGTTLYGSLNDSFGGGGLGLPVDLARIDPATGVVTRVGSLPGGVDALASSVP
jgi:hypothetical protein